jgi:prepilin-type N-terminal cleavage/methylation domain-containing protein
MRRNTGFTLMETLVAIAIVLLVAAILFPVLSEAKRAGIRSESIVHLRQVGIAIEQYRNDYDGRLGFEHLDPYVEAGHVKNRGVLVSRADLFDDGYGHALSKCRDGHRAMETETSYEALFSNKNFFDYVKTVDPNAAILVDRTHGSRFDDADGTCRLIEYFYSGRILRLYEDTSVKTANFSITDWKASPTTGLAWHRIRLFTDIEPPLLPSTDTPL